jgi:uncharacterized protein YjbI with pentapeptide repeats
MKTLIDNETFIKWLAQHKIWLAEQINPSAPSKGKQLELVDAALSDCEEREADFSCAALVRCTVSNAHFEKCDFSNTLLIDTIFNNCDFEHCNFTKADLQRASGSGCRFRATHFTRADLTDCNLSGASLTDCHFDWAWLVRTDLRYAILDGTQFNETRIANAKFYNKNYPLLFKALAKATIEELVFSPKGENFKAKVLAPITV